MLARVTDYGAPVSLALKAARTAQQEALVMHVRGLERHAKELIKQLEADREVERQSVILGRAFLKTGCMLLVNGIMRDDLL
jgi:hypothetical protein